MEPMSTYQVISMLGTIVLLVTMLFATVLYLISIRKAMLKYKAYSTIEPTTRAYLPNVLNAILDDKSVSTSSRTYCVSVVKIDGYKSMGDKYVEKDIYRFIRSVASIVIYHVGVDDVVAISDEGELTIIHQDTNLHQTRNIMDNIRKYVSNHQIKSLYSDLYIEGTVSIGLSASYKHDDQLRSVFARARLMAERVFISGGNDIEAFDVRME